MKKFFSTKFGKRVPVAVLMLVLAVVLGAVLADYVGPETTMLQRTVYCMGVIGTVVSALAFLFLGLPGLALGYGFILVLLLPRVLPEPWNRYFSFVYLAALLGLPPLLKRRPQKQGSPAKPEKTAPMDISSEEAPIFVLQNLNGRVYQLLRGAGRLCAYRVGGELRGINTEQVVGSGHPRPLGPRDFSVPLDDIRSLKFKPNGTYGVTVHLKAGRKRLSLAPFGGTSPEALERFFRGIAPGAAPEKTPPERGNPARRAILNRVQVGLLVAIGVINLPWLFLDVPYRLFSVLSLLPFPITVGLICAFPKDVTLTEVKGKGDGRAQMLYPLVFSGFGPALRTLMDFNFLAWKPMLLWCLGLLVAVVALLAICSRECRKISMLLCTAFLSLFFCVGAVGQVNYLLDFSQPVQTAAVIEEMHISTSSKGPDSYYLNVVTEDGKHMELQVGKEKYESLTEGDAVTVSISNGALGIPYADAQ